jgi:hypothetical protein
MTPVIIAHDYFQDLRKSLDKTFQVVSGEFLTPYTAYNRKSYIFTDSCQCLFLAKD